MVLRKAKSGTSLDDAMTEKARILVSLGDEPMGQGSVDSNEEIEKVWDLGPGEYDVRVVNRGTWLDKSRMYVIEVRSGRKWRF